MSIYDKIRADENYRKYMSGPVARLQTLAHAAEFKAIRPGRGSELTEEDVLTDIASALSDTYGSLDSGEIKAGITNGRKLASFLKKRNRDGKSYFDIMREEALANGIAIQTFYEDMYYLDDVLELGLDIPSLDRKSVPEKYEIKEGMGWDEYSYAHLVNIPYSMKGREDYLARALTGAFLAGEKKRNENATEVPFTLKNAERLTKQIKDKPVFRQLCKDPDKVKAMLAEGREDPDRLFNMSVSLTRPFYATTREKRKEILERLKNMEPLLDGPTSKDEKWSRLHASIRSIDLSDPEKSGERKMQEILNNVTDYMKGRKSLRKSKNLQNRFDQAMDVLAELAGANEFAQSAAQILVDRTNEVRLGHDRDYDRISLKQFGARRIAGHTNTKDRFLVKNYQDTVEPRKAPRREEKRYKANIFEPYPELDAKLLERQPKGIAPMEVKDATSELTGFALGGEMSQRESLEMLSNILALSECQMYVREGRRTGETKVVFDSGKFMELSGKYMNDPAVKQLAGRLTDPDERRNYMNSEDDCLDFNLDKMRSDIDGIRKEISGAQKQL